MFSEDVQSFLGPGDRAPNFVLPAADGLLWVFYERVRGFRNILLVCPAGWREAEGELTALADAWPRLQELGVDVFALFDGGVEETARLSEGLSLPFLVFADPEGRFRVPYAKGFGRDPSRPVCLLLDENQRVGTVLDAAEESFAARALAAFASGPPAGPAELRAGTAPVLIVPDVLDSGACASLIALWHGSHEEGVAQGRDMDGQDVVKVDYAYKKRRDHQVEDPRAAAWLGRVLSRRVGPELAKAFHLDRFAFDRFVVTCYDAERGDYFRPHRDNTTEGTQDRIYAMTLNLNTGDYTGGGLRFPEYGPQLYAPPAGGAILFSCSLIHEATPVTEGQRFTLLTFLRDPEGAGDGGKLGVWGKR